jgi:hypothetical protein
VRARPSRAGAWRTLFLDEIADMPLTTQGKILRVLTDQSYHRVGGQRPVKVDVRVLSGTSRNLQDEIAGARFREDLFYRLNVVPVRLPPLRERREDIPELVSHFLARFASDRRMSPPTISAEAIAALQAHDWPGNVRQLRNIIERTIILAPGDRVSRIDVDLLPPEILENQGVAGGSTATMAIMGSPLREARESFEREYLKIQIRRFSATSPAPHRSSGWSGLRCTGTQGLASGTREKGRNRRISPIWLSFAQPAGSFPHSLRRAKLPHHLPGERRQASGVVTWFDTFSLLLRRDGSSSWSTSIRSRPSCHRRSGGLPFPRCRRSRTGRGAAGRLPARRTKAQSG